MKKANSNGAINKDDQVPIVLPPINSFTLCDVINSPKRRIPRLLANKNQFNRLIRVKNPKRKQNQAQMPYIMDDSHKIADKEKMFSIIKYIHRPMDFLPVEAPKPIENLVKSPTCTSDGIRHIIMIRPSIFNDCFQSNELFKEPKHTHDLSDTSVVMSSFRTKNPIRKNSFVFNSFLQSLQNNVFQEICIPNPSIKSMVVSSLPAPVLPPISLIHLFNDSIAKYEFQKLKGQLILPRRISISMPPQMIKKPSKFLREESDLLLCNGEFTVIEYLDEHPITLPLIGMVSRLDVITDDYQSGDHPYDRRIPLTKISSAGSQPFVSRIPSKTFVMMLSNSVFVSAVSPHVSNDTDFIICLGKVAYICKMPFSMYLSSYPESRIRIPHPTQKVIQDPLGSFLSKPLPPPEELCRRRSIISGLRTLNETGINNPVSKQSFTKEFKERLGQLDQEMQSAIIEYMEIMKSTPWNRSRNIIKLKLGHLGRKEESLENIYVARSKKDMKEFLEKAFYNQLWSIQNHGSNEPDIDISLFDISDDYSEDSDFVLEDEIIQEKQDYWKNQKNCRFNVDWDSLGFHNCSKRKCMKVVKYYIEEGKAMGEIEWIRDKKYITSKLRDPNTRFQPTTTIFV